MENGNFKAIEVSLKNISEDIKEIKTDLKTHVSEALHARGKLHEKINKNTSSIASMKSIFGFIHGLIATMIAAICSFLWSNKGS